MKLILIRFEAFAAVIVKNTVFWDVTQCGFCKNQRFGGIIASIIRAKKSAT
jgi:hypothetical protein